MLRLSAAARRASILPEAGGLRWTNRHRSDPQSCFQLARVDAAAFVVYRREDLLRIAGAFTRRLSASCLCFRACSTVGTGRALLLTRPPLSAPQDQATEPTSDTGSGARAEVGPGLSQDTALPLKIQNKPKVLGTCSLGWPF